MPEPVRAMQEAYGYGQVKVRIPPTGKDISEMEETFGWINQLPEKADRLECFRYGEIKTGKGTFAQYLEKNDIHRRNYERQISKIFLKVADILNQSPKMRMQAPTLPSVANPVYERRHKLGEPRRSHWMAEGARPTIRK